MAMKKVSAKAELPKSEEKAPESTETVNDGASNAPSEPEPTKETTPEEPTTKVETPKEPEKTPEVKTYVPGPDGKVPCKALKTCFNGGMVRYEGQTFRAFVDVATTQAARGDLEILG